MFVPADVKARVAAKVDECIEIANKSFKRTFTTPTIKYEVRGRVGGIARVTQNIIDFNSVLLMENLDHFIDSTVPHEVAHIIDHVVYGFQHNGRKAIHHGRTWKMIMRIFGVDPNRCHTYDVTNAAVKNKAKFHYVCKTCKRDIFVSSVIHNKIRRGQHRYCVRCGHVNGTLVFKQAVGKVTWQVARDKVAAQNQQIQQQVTVNPPAPTNMYTSKKAGAIQLYKDIVLKGHGKDVFIQRCIDVLGMTKAGATTYFYTCKKEETT